MPIKQYIASVVVPLKNEEGNVLELHSRIVEACNLLVYKQLITGYEIIFINDGSRDQTLNIIKKLRPLTIINFRKSFGQTAAMDAGIKQAKGEIIITLDGDLQNDPADFEKLLSKMAEGYDVISGWRADRKDDAFRMFLSKVANKVRKAMLGDNIHDTGCSLKAYKKECFDNVDLQGEMHRFIPAILNWSGYKIGEVKVSHMPRMNGKSNYKNFKRTIKVIVDMISIWFWRRYAARPLHIFGTSGMILFLIGSILTIFSLISRILWNQDLSGSGWFFLAIFFCLSGVVLFTSGIITDIVIKIYYKTEKTRPYNIKEIIKN